MSEEKIEMRKVNKQRIDDGREVMPKAYMYLEWIVANFEKKDVSLAVQCKLVLVILPILY